MFITSLEHFALQLRDVVYRLYQIQLPLLHPNHMSDRITGVST